MKKFFLAGLIFFLSVGLAMADGYESEPNDDKESADPIESGTTYQGIFTGQDDDDWYVFETSGGPFSLYLHAGDYNFNDGYWTADLYHGDDAVSLVSAPMSDGDIDVEMDLDAGTYYIKIHCPYASYYAYTYYLTVFYEEGAATDECDYNGDGEVNFADFQAKHKDVMDALIEEGENCGWID